MATELGYLLDPQPEGMRVMGPAEAPVLKVKSEFRYQILLKAAQPHHPARHFEKTRSFAEKEKWKATSLVIDVDPISLM